MGLPVNYHICISQPKRSMQFRPQLKPFFRQIFSNAILACLRISQTVKMGKKRFSWFLKYLRSTLKFHKGKNSILIESDRQRALYFNQFWPTLGQKNLSISTGFIVNLILLFFATYKTEYQRYLWKRIFINTSTFYIKLTFLIKGFWKVFKRFIFHIFDNFGNCCRHVFQILERIIQSQSIIWKLERFKVYFIQCWRASLVLYLKNMAYNCFWWKLLCLQSFISSTVF